MRNPIPVSLVLFAILALGSFANGAVKAADTTDTAGIEAELPYGDVVEIAPNARLIVGRALNFQAGEVDIANVLLYKSGSTLVVIDTGGTSGFVEYLDKAAEQLRPFEKVLLITTHGHADHVGNNAWIDTLGVPATHLISSHDLALMRDQIGYFAPRLDAAVPYLPGSPSGEQFAQQLIDLFGGLNTETKNITLFESLPMEEIKIGETLWNGWRLLGGDVMVLRTSGHTRGHVAVFLPALKLLHLADETTGYYQAFPGGSPATNLLTLERAAEAVKEGAVEIVTDGHSFKVHRGDEAAQYLNRFVSSALNFNAAVARILTENRNGITVGELVAEVAKSPEMAGAPAGANPIPIFGVMLVLNKLKELGVAIPDTPDAMVKFPG